MKKILSEAPIHGFDAWAVIVRSLVRDGYLVYRKGDWILTDPGYELKAYDVNQLADTYLTNHDS